MPHAHFVLHSFSSFNAARMRVHLTGEAEGQTRVAECKRVPKACKEFYQAERVNLSSGLLLVKLKMVN